SFTRNRYTLTVSKTGNGSGTVTSTPAGVSCGTNCSGQFDYGTVVTLHATPTTSSTFTGWSGACTGTGNCVVTMSQARSAIASFTLKQYALTVGRSGSGSGSVTSSPAGISCPTSCSVSFNYGTLVTLSATPDTGSSFAGWGGVCAGTGTCQVTMSQARNVTASFTLNQYTLTV